MGVDNPLVGPAEYPAKPGEGEHLQGVLGVMKRQVYRYTFKGESVTVNVPCELLPEGPFPYIALVIYQKGAEIAHLTSGEILKAGESIPLHFSAEEAVAGTGLIVNVMV